MKTSSAKAKGRKLQAEVRQLILETFTALEEDDVKVAIMGETGIDVHLSPAARKKFPYSIECKNQEKIGIWAALSQAEENCKPGTSPLLIFRRNRTKPYVALSLEDFMKLYAESGHEENGLKSNSVTTDDVASESAIRRLEES